MTITPTPRKFALCRGMTDSPGDPIHVREIAPGNILIDDIGYSHLQQPSLVGKHVLCGKSLMYDYDEAENMDKRSDLCEECARIHGIMTK